jgi:putative transposase
MKRRHRKNYNDPGHAHELTFSCYRRFAFLQAQRTCQWLTAAIEASRENFNFQLWAYVFMPDHAHLILCPKEPQYDIASIRQGIKSPVASSAIKYLENYRPD